MREVETPNLGTPLWTVGWGTKTKKIFPSQLITIFVEPFNDKWDILRAAEVQEQSDRGVGQGGALQLPSERNYFYSCKSLHRRKKSWP